MVPTLDTSPATPNDPKAGVRSPATEALTATPGALNLVLLATSAGLACGFLWLASQDFTVPVTLAAGLGFSLVGNTLYALMHEAVHWHYHPVRWINEFVGRIASAFFPMAFSLQRAFHLAHHRDNRTDSERFDYYTPDERRGLKRLQWYLILSGTYWLLLPAFCLFYFLFAGFLNWPRLFGRRLDWLSRQSHSQHFLDVIGTVPTGQARADILFSAAVQTLIILGLGLSWTGWLTCYACFAVNWSSLQYTDHAFSELDTREGAWNLRVSPPIRLIYLNYHFHLVHHRDPALPWTVLPRHVRPDDPAPGFWSIYRQMLRGPRPLPTTATPRMSDRR